MSDMLQMLAEVALELWEAHLIGTSALTHTRRFNRICNPVIGDWVIETSTSGWWRKQAQPNNKKYTHICVENACGKLLRIEMEHRAGDPDDPDDPGYDEKITVIRRMDGTEFRWENAKFITFLPGEGWDKFWETFCVQ